MGELTRADLIQRCAGRSLNTLLETRRVMICTVKIIPQGNGYMRETTNGQRRWRRSYGIRELLGGLTGADLIQWWVGGVLNNNLEQKLSRRSDVGYMKETTNGCHWRQRQLKSNRAIFPLIELSLDRSKPGWLVDQLEKNKHKDKRQQKIFLEHFVNTFFLFY